MKTYYIIAFLFIATTAAAQRADTTKKGTKTDSLFESMNAEKNKADVVIFESPRLVLSQSTETIKKNNLLGIFIHRFGDFAGSAGGGRLYYGLDDIADVYLGVDYGLTDNLNIELGRTTIPMGGGLTDLQLKYALLHQTNDGSSPLAITVLGQSAVNLYHSFNSFGDRLSYFGEVIFARRFSHSLSLQIAPSIVQNNTPIPDVEGSGQQIFSLSAAASLKVSRLMAFVVDYAHPFSSFRSGANGFSDPFGVGLQIVTGGHVFTVNVTNARAVSEINYLSNTTSDYGRGQYRLGFTISRNFDFNHKEVYHPKNQQ